MSAFDAFVATIWLDLVLSLVSVGLAVLLLALLVAKRWFTVPRAAFRIGFVCGLAVCVAWIVDALLPARTGISLSINITGFGGVVFGSFVFMPIGTGLAGFASFSSRWRYPPLLLSFLGLLAAGGFVFLVSRILFLPTLR